MLCIVWSFFFVLHCPSFYESSFSGDISDGLAGSLGHPIGVLWNLLNFINFNLNFSSKKLYGFYRYREP